MAMKSATILRLLVILAFLCAFSPESQSGPPQAPGYKPPSHAQHPPGYKPPTHNAPGNTHHFTPPPHAAPARPPVVHPSPSPHPRPMPHPGFYPPPPPPPRIPVYLYPPVVLSYPTPVPVPTYVEPQPPTYYEGSQQAGSDMKQIGIFRAYVYKDDKTDDVQQNGVAVFYLNEQNLIGGYFYVKQGVQPLTIQGIANKETGDVEFRVNGTNGTYFTKLNELITRDKVFLTLERENEDGVTEALQVGYLSRVQEKL
ncbi:MAG: hypothetical protein IJQ31_02235 [Thermoguttaceae bacterium]|nr:hypothetical protein [Thermoguttaceae bacterium]